MGKSRRWSRKGCKKDVEQDGGTRGVEKGGGRTGSVTGSGRKTDTSWGV